MFKSENHKKTVVIMMILAFFILGISACVRHYNFKTQAFDMGITVQFFWNSTHGHLMESSIENVQGVKNHFSMHWGPILLVFVPLFAVFSSPYFLLLAQSLALVLGAWPLFLLAKKKLEGKNENWPVLFTGAYLLYPSLFWVNNFDFHELAFFVPFMLTALYFLEEENWKWMAVFLTLSALVKEDAILAVIFVGVYLILKKRFKAGIITSVAAAIYFAATMKFIIPAFGGEFYHAVRYSYLGSSSFPHILKSVFTSAKIFYLSFLLLPVMLTPVMSGRALVLLSPGLAENLLSSWGSQISGTYQYDALLIPAIFFCAILGFKRILEKKYIREKHLRIIFIIFVLTSFIWRSPLGPLNFSKEFSEEDRTSRYRKITKMVPAGASVAAQTNMVPHLAARREIFMLGTEPEHQDVVLIDGADLFGFADGKTLQSYADDYINTGKYDFKEFENRYFILYRKGITLRMDSSL